MPPVDFALDEHVRPSLQRKGARIGVEFSPFEGALDIEGSGVVPLDEIRIIAVHDADVIGQFRRAVGVQTTPRPIASERISTARSMSLEEIRSPKSRGSMRYGVSGVFSEGIFERSYQTCYALKRWVKSV